jgi:hypothetical protein
MAMKMEWITRDEYEGLVTDGQSMDRKDGGDGSREYIDGYLRERYLIYGEDPFPKGDIDAA